jgi:hypothetical protein
MTNRNSKGRAPEAKEGIEPIAGSKSMTRPGPTASEIPQTVRIRLLGGFSVSVGSRNIPQDEWRLKKAAALVKLLALTPGNRMHRELYRVGRSTLATCRAWQA